MYRCWMEEGVELSKGRAGREEMRKGKEALTKRVERIKWGVIILHSTLDASPRTWSCSGPGTVFECLVGEGAYVAGVVSVKTDEDYVSKGQE
jgi:hypothetical protein